MVNHLHRNPPRLRLVKRPRRIAMQRRPSLFIHFRLECGYEGFLWVVLSLPPA